MASSFLSSAGKKVTDVRSFLRDAAGGTSIKYTPEKGRKHLIYIPFEMATTTDETGAEVSTKELKAYTCNVHDWQSPDGKYKATICTKDTIRNDENGNVLNDGTCPFCDRIGDAWDIYRYRKELEESSCKLVGDQRKEHLKNANSTFGDERKAKEAKPYMYILIVKYRQSDSGDVVMGQDNLPEYDLKVMKLSASRVEKIQQQIANSGGELPGTELMFEYPNTDDRRLLVSQSTTAPVFPNNMMTVKYPALINKINEDVAKFSWDGIEKSFPEWAGMTVMEAKKVTDSLFEQWDKYLAELQINPGARYMEYVTSTPVSTPQLGGNVPTAGAVPGAAVPGVPGVPNIPGVLPGVAPQQTVPGVAAQPAAAPGVAAPTVPNIPDPNGIFNSGAGGIQL